jgi:hypothetical protein
MTKEKKIDNIVSTPVTEIVKQKRGRKPKKDIVNETIKQDEKPLDNNIIFSIQETTIVNENVIENDFFNISNNTTDINDVDINDVDINDVVDDNIVLSSENNQEEQKPGGKKRGRKPKGGKIIQQVVSLNNNKETKPNIILHLKCSLKDLQTNTFMSTNIECFNFVGKNDLNYEIINSNTENNIQTNIQNNIQNNTSCSDSITCNDDNTEIYDEECYSKNKENDIRDVWKKLKVLEHNLHINNISDKKSACFWCTYEFDNPPIYIPKHFIKDSYHVYGCFCSPECATAYLMEENIDSSSKFERYHLINHVYSKIYDYKKNIKPAPNPFYLLDKYYGNLSIQEFRSLLRNERLFLVVDKPLTRILPELHEDNDDFIINNKIIPANTLLIKKKLQKKQQPKNAILNEKFGLNQ